MTGIFTPAYSVSKRTGSDGPSPDRAVAISLDSAADLSWIDSTQDDAVDPDHQPTDLAVR
jgi:hypothetical protein